MIGSLILIGGGSCSGKTTLASSLKDTLGKDAVLISTDNFYKGVGQNGCRNVNFDHPGMIDFDYLRDSVASLLSGRDVEIPLYDFSTHSRLDEKLKIKPAQTVIIEGIFALYQRKILEMSRLKVFVDCGIDIMIRRRIERDVKERGRSVRDIVAQFLDTVLPMYYEYVLPTRRNADIILDGRGDYKELLRDILNRLGVE
ncbi:MAG: uridine kinase [Sedimentisphaeraceae bacterium JB056]